MNERLIVQICEIILAAISVAGIIFILGATWYDLRAVHHQTRIKALSSKITGRRQLPITVLVYARNAAATITACLDSISASTYKNFKVIVADNCSTDDTNKHLTTYKRTHTNTPLTSYRAKIIADRPTILQQAGKKDKSGQLILTLDAADIIPPTLLQDCAVRFAVSDDIDALYLRPTPNAEVSILSLSTHFYALSRNIMSKSFSHSSLLQRRSPVMAARRSVIQQKKLSQKNRIHYESTLAYTQLLLLPSLFSSTNIIQTRSWKKLVYTLAVLFTTGTTVAIMTYFFYTAAILQSNILLTLSWTIVCLWLLASIWLDDLSTLERKVSLTLTVPFVYFILYIQLIVMFVTALKQVAARIPLPNQSLRTIQRMIQLELYSVRY
jgi:hypothetical protein